MESNHATVQVLRATIYFILSQAWLVACAFATVLYPDSIHLLGLAYVVLVGGLFSDPILEVLLHHDEPKIVSRAEQQRILKNWAIGFAIWVALASVAVLSGHPAGFLVSAGLALILAKPPYQMWWPVEG